VFQLIRQTGNKGIWTKDLKTQSNLQQPQINKCLKALEGRKLVKAVKSVANGNRKVFMLFELEPSREITGGAWYTGHEYDSEFIDVLRQQCRRYIEHEGRATVDMMYDFVRSTKLSRVELSVADVLQIVNTLVYDGRVDAHESGRDNGQPYVEGTVFYTPGAQAREQGAPVSRPPSRHAAADALAPHLRALRRLPRGAGLPRGRRHQPRDVRLLRGCVARATCARVLARSRLRRLAAMIDRVRRMGGRRYLAATPFLCL